MKKKVQTVKTDKKQRENKIEMKIGYACCAAAEISGDALISCRLPGGSRALILSDGMGKGIKAAAGSRLVVGRLRRNLQAGMTVARAIKEVNRYMIDHGCREDFATADMTIIDPVSCRAKFYKMGAAASYIVRQGRVRQIAGAALPVGIIPRLRLTHITAMLKPGDIIVLVSDGITEADRRDLNARWLEEYLSAFAAAKAERKGGDISPRQLAAAILRKAESLYEGRERDDLTVGAVIIADSGTNR